MKVDASFNLVREEYAENSIQRALKEERFTEKDAELVRTFTNELQATAGVSISRVNKITFTLVGWRKVIPKPFNQCTVNDIHKGIMDLKKTKSLTGKTYKPNTISDFLKVLKQFYIWLAKNKFTKIPRDRIEEIKAPGRDPMTTVASDLLTPDEITQMIKGCKRDSDRALLLTLYEGAFRIGEIGRLKWGDLKFDEYGVIANVSFKTDKPRYIRLVMALDYLSRWRSIYPGTPEGDSLVFVNRNGDPLTHAQVRRQIERIAERAGITKRVNPHVFRHSRITHLVREGASESVIKAVAWGSQDSRMLKTYLHLTGQDVDNEMLKLYGIEVPEKKKERGLKPHQCGHCSTINSPTSTYCSTCGHPLTSEASHSVIEGSNKIRELLSESPQAQTVLLELLKELQSQPA
ncbi:tyrosine-type recombinase/integrase [Methanoregula sp.]|uniref:tyrosine-type recombinase/integrase n=1 Tax=Methanoregula sp. TaxID=2052170 RepID=UPI002374CB5D|nr:tyrosine-type recombinase/integrase [Methanoregula sp.]MDD1686070.1 tyrosine-type recombinase/integrase [Methanoregula sp.]